MDPTDDDDRQFTGILGNLGLQPGGILSSLFRSQPGPDPRQLDPTALSLAAAASASDLARTLRAIDHQAAIMTAFGKAVGAPGTTADSPSQGGGAGPSVPAAPPDAASSGPVLSADAMAQAAQEAPAAPVDVNAVFRRSPLPLPLSRPKPNVPQWPTPGVVEQRWPGLANPDTSALLQGIASVPSPTKPVLTYPDWSGLPHGVASVPSPDPPQPGLENPDTRTLLQDIAAVPSPPRPDLPALRTNHIDPDDLVRRIVRGM